MTSRQLFQSYLDQCPLIAIIRGVTPDESEATARAIYDAGIRIIEVPLNSPDPLDSIRRISAMLGEGALVGAGTVLRPESVGEVHESGGRIVVAPNTNPAVIRAAVDAGLVSCPGYFTSSEAFEALDAGATALKLFPAEGASPAVLKAQRAVLPKDVPVIVVGGVRPDNMQPWLEAGAQGFGLGSGLYAAGQSPEQTAQKARAYVAGVHP